MWKALKIDERLHQAIKEYAEAQGLKIQYIVTKALMEYLSKEATKCQ